MGNLDDANNVQHRSGVIDLFPTEYAELSRY